MDHKQLATSSGRRGELLYPNWNSCSIIELPRKARFKTRLPYAPDAWQRFSQHSIQKSPSTPLFSRTGFVFAPRGTTTFAPLFLRLDLAGNFGSSSCRYGPRLTLLRPQPADNDTRPGFSEAGEPVLRNLRGADALRESVNRVKSHPKSWNKLACYSRHMRGRGADPSIWPSSKAIHDFLNPTVGIRAPDADNRCLPVFRFETGKASAISAFFRLSIRFGEFFAVFRHRAEA